MDGLTTVSNDDLTSMVKRWCAGHVCGGVDGGRRWMFIRWDLTAMVKLLDQYGQKSCEWGAGDVCGGVDRGRDHPPDHLTIMVKS